MQRILLLLLAIAFAGVLAAQGVTNADGILLSKTRSLELAPNGWDAGKFSQDMLASARLYYTRDEGKSWNESLEGLTTGRNGTTLYFPFNADDDGLFGFRYVLKGEAAPSEGSVAHSRLYIDTTAPSVQILSPVDGEYLKAGSPVTISYRVQDANLDSKTGLTITYSTDGGKTWSEVVTKGAVSNSYTWNSSLISETDLWINVEVKDLLGNSRPVQRQRLKVGQAASVRKADRPYVSFTGPLYGKDKEELGKIYFEDTDFYFTVDNRTGSPTAMVVLWYNINSKDWVAGGVDISGAATGKITVSFPEQMRRNENYGNFMQMGFYYQVICEDGTANKPDPVSTSAKDDTYLVDTDAPHLALLEPLPGTKLYKKRIPNNEDSGKLKISWAGVDRNAIPYITERGHERGPVRIQWRVFGSRETNDWQILADRLPLRGVFLVENDLPAGKVEFMVTAIDQLGNEKIQRSRPVEIIDSSGYTDPVKGLANLDADRVWTNGINFYKAGQYELAIVEFDKALKMVPSEKRDELNHDRALAVYRTGRINDATRSLTKIIGNQPENMTFRYSLATIHYRTGQRDEARAQLLKIVPIDSKEPHIKARSMLAAIENDRGETTEAKRQWEFVLEHASKSSDEYRDAEENLKLAKAKDSNAKDPAVK